MGGHGSGVVLFVAGDRGQRGVSATSRMRPLSTASVSAPRSRLASSALGSNTNPCRALHPTAADGAGTSSGNGMIAFMSGPQTGRQAGQGRNYRTAVRVSGSAGRFTAPAANMGRAGQCLAQWTDRNVDPAFAPSGLEVLLRDLMRPPGPGHSRDDGAHQGVELVVVYHVRRHGQPRALGHRREDPLQICGDSTSRLVTGCGDPPLPSAPAG